MPDAVAGVRPRRGRGTPAPARFRSADLGRSRRLARSLVAPAGHRQRAKRPSSLADPALMPCFPGCGARQPAVPRFTGESRAFRPAARGATGRAAPRPTCRFLSWRCAVPRPSGSTRCGRGGCAIDVRPGCWHTWTIADMMRISPKGRSWR
ncbi:hypothetical protein ALSL_0282 [Aerosticca soli]|uniref:Uncharacterized protein n=1 Tax=Aerosticca soli TaxID=2010829 RepID=A0A2Z6E2G1_9GAMM|nr:hypothetical protein ALSL_0282 [Aerosticca soli]